MSHYFVFAGVDSRNFNTYLATSNMFDSPERDVERLSIPGRNGDLIYDNGRYNNFDGTLTAYTRHDMARNTDALRSFLSSQHGYKRYEDTMHPDEYRMARFVGPFTVESSDRMGAAYTLAFDCKPQRYLKSGERMTAYSSGVVLYNPTRFDALPLIRCMGNGSITINGKTITISGNSGTIDIDCDLQEAYYGTTNKNAYITPTFPTLAPGSNTLRYSGVTNVQIMPRWWHI